MINRFNWNSYWRPDPQSPWQWAGEGAFFSEANGQAVLKFTGGEILVVFGRMMPGEYERKWRRMTA